MSRISEQNCGHGMVHLHELFSSWDNLNPIGHDSKLYILNDQHSRPTGEADLVIAARVH